MTKTCAVCERAFTCLNAYAKYCGDPCEQRQRRLRHLDKARARDRERRQKGLVHRSVNYRAANRAYYHSHKPQHRDRRFERKIRTLPESIQEMRRVLLRFKRWCRAHGYTLKNMGTA